MKKILAAALLAIGIAGVASAQQLPPGKWWRKPEVVQRLELSSDQQSRLDAIFRNAANELIDLRGEVEKQNIALRSELEETQLDRTAIQRIANRLNDARARLFQRELMMLVDMRAVLSDAQWARMRQAIDQMRDRAEERGGPNRPRPPRP